MQILSPRIDIGGDTHSERRYQPQVAIDGVKPIPVAHIDPFVVEHRRALAAATESDTPAQGARRLVQMSKQLLQAQQTYLENVRKIVAVHTVLALKNELGDDEATAMQAFYTATKGIVEATAPNINVPDIA